MVAWLPGLMDNPTRHSLVDLRDLQLGDARALLQHGVADSQPALDESPVQYLQSLIDGLCQLSLTDPLTGLTNRRHFESVLETEISAVARSGEAALLLLLDVDHFKQVNDIHGHAAGDQVLKAVAMVLFSCVRPMDTVARYGGEEFGVVLHNCQASFGQTVAERIRQSIAAMRISPVADATIQVTISVGGAYALDCASSSVASWTERADLELYRAKSEGRNRICMDHQAVFAVSAEEKGLLFGDSGVSEPALTESTPGNASCDAGGRNPIFMDHQVGFAVSAEEKGLLFGHTVLSEPALTGSTPGNAPPDAG